MVESTQIVLADIPHNINIYNTFISLATAHDSTSMHFVMIAKMGML